MIGQEQPQVQVHKQQKFTLSEQQAEEYRKKGHICLRSLIKPQDFAHFRGLMNKAIDEVSGKGISRKELMTIPIFLHRVSPETSYFILSQYFGGIAAQLMGVNRVRLYHDQALVKFPQAGKTPWHQDYFYWPIDSPNTITMWMPLHDCPRTMGTMQFATGSHEDNTIDPQPINESSESYYAKLIEQKKLNMESYDLKAGDATFHSGKTIHCAYPNGEHGKREVITIIYYEDGVKALPQDKLNQFRKVDLKVFCPGVQPSQTIQSDLNPLVS